MDTTAQLRSTRRGIEPRALPQAMLARLSLATVVLCIGLSSCTGFSNYVSDNWPTWAGGMPKDVPPRPGAPGYDDFVAHHAQQAPPGEAAPGAMPVAATSAVGAPATAPVAAAPVAPTATAPAATSAYQRPVPPPVAARPNDAATVQGGLY